VCILLVLVTYVYHNALFKKRTVELIFLHVTHVRIRIRWAAYVARMGRGETYTGF
jgi:hypothetical protein